MPSMTLCFLNFPGTEGNGATSKELALKRIKAHARTNGRSWGGGGQGKGGGGGGHEFQPPSSYRTSVANDA